MSDKRRDHKGRVLRTGESQRAEMRYQFRYMDARGKRRSIYSMDLKELHAKEEEVLSATKAGVDYAAGQITVQELVERYTSLKNGVRYTGFILLDKDDKPKVALHIENEMRWAMHKYKLLHPDKPLPHITPHVLRHTFCTNMATAGMNVKGLQYLMGHSDVEVTMNVYTHADYDFAAEELSRIVQFPGWKDAKREGTRA